MILAVLPLFLTAGIGAPVYAVGLIEGVADGLAALVKVISGRVSDRIRRRHAVGVVGYAITTLGFAGLVAVATWPQALVGRTVAWMGRGLRMPIRSSLLAASVDAHDYGKAFGFHEALDTAGAVVGPAIALLLLSSGSDFRSVFIVAAVPGVIAVLLFAGLVRDPRRGHPTRPRAIRAVGDPFLRLLAAVGVFGIGNFAHAFFTLRAAEMIGRSEAENITFAVGFYLAVNAIGALSSFPAGWLADAIGRTRILAAGYILFGLACVAAIAGSGMLGVVMMAIPLGISNPLIKSTESSVAGGLVQEDLHGTAYGLLEGVNGVGDLLSSVVAGLLWSASGAPTAMAFGASLSVLGAALLLLLV